ncbi:hypothetical protein AVEN_186146-1 [Araneus ventricosus]|uniref:Immunoglobulin V-set domain-containing protein n=1 Tax=Araneus ventricosus TaxID=182803 RepID=A0A4Y2DSR1_ARAVE|nr:hypothetical protein AVEN_186146-1 [Araneus ventricosus]
METYTSDERFEALHLQKSNDWTLQIKYTQLRDSGTYECQVSSDPKISFFVNLTIVDIFIDSGFIIQKPVHAVKKEPYPLRNFLSHDVILSFYKTKWRKFSA